MIIKSLELHNFRQFMDDEDGHGQRLSSRQILIRKQLC